MQRPEDGSDETGFGSFDNSMYKRVYGVIIPQGLKYKPTDEEIPLSSVMQSRHNR